MPKKSSNVETVGMAQSLLTVLQETLANRLQSLLNRYDAEAKKKQPNHAKIRGLIADIHDLLEDVPSDRPLLPQEMDEFLAFCKQIQSIETLDMFGVRSVDKVTEEGYYACFTTRPRNNNAAIFRKESKHSHISVCVEFYENGEFECVRFFDSLQEDANPTYEGNPRFLDLRFMREITGIVMPASIV